ncbi:hypothetical protein V5P93_003477 [Actinokineospora auranticolor]|uniref:Uncharacterized protein n=1 Tax=Actinokineospora auranticolor TaxID=155976 RepID=A0A2S6GPN7_9PSEU|nr:hypothetical protein [Actinokineospora auranticolor]PPK67140.1 hypothetical protein CLV40_108137 [Actinokineospora auranticolor]
MSAPIAGETIVRNCVVRVVRRGGWSWGPDPRGIVRLVVDALPELLAGQFADHLDGEGPDVEISEPVRLSVVWGRSRGSGGVPSVEFAVDPGASVVPEPREVAREEWTGSSSTSDTQVAVRASVSDTALSPVTLFGELAERGELAALLALLPDETLRVCLAASLDGPGERPRGEVIGALAAEVARRGWIPEPSSPVATLVELRELVRSLPRVASAPHVSSADVERVVQTSASPAGETTRECAALPFLLVGPLARTGYLDAVGPALASVGLLHQTPLFAAALARRVLGGSADAAVFACLDSVPDLGDFARRVGPALPVLDGVLALAVCRGHDPVDPLLVAGVDGGLLLVDAQGLFPVAWTARAVDLLPYWEACGRPAVVVCDSPLPTSCLRELAEAGVPLVTDVRPLRGDPLTRLPRPAPLWVSGAPGSRVVAEFPRHAERLDELTRALFARPGDALERGTGLAAALSLGVLAWTLWRETETPHPATALTRFADLEATVRFTDEAVRVRLPLGRRHADLLRGGALVDVPDVVWLGGRTLTFSGG